MTELMSGPGSVDLGHQRVFTARTRFDAPLHVVEMSGELDEAGRAEAIRTCTRLDHLDVLVDLSGLVFMGCAGYSALAASTSILERRGGSLVMVNPVGAPRRLLELIGALEGGLCAPLRYDPQSVPGMACGPSGRPGCRSIPMRGAGVQHLPVDERELPDELGIR